MINCSHHLALKDKHSFTRLSLAYLTFQYDSLQNKLVPQLIAAQWKEQIISFVSSVAFFVESS